jgi:hypothetical protein
MRNFRCFDILDIKGCRRFNVVVGDNGAGKAALFEALFLVLSGNVEVGIRLKVPRGLEPAFAGAVKAIEDAVWLDYFYQFDWSRPIAIELKGSGSGARSLTISRGMGELFIPFRGGTSSEASALAPLQFVWRDAQGREHPSSITVAISYSEQLGRWLDVRVSRVTRR